MKKIYPRLERRKLKRIEAGKRPYYSLEDKALFCSFFEKGMNNEVSHKFILNDNGEIIKQELCCAHHISNGDDFFDEDDAVRYDEYAPANPVFNAKCGNAARVENTEFERIEFSINDMFALRDAYERGTLNKVFVKMIKEKSK